jgi:hypothetical protein
MGQADVDEGVEGVLSSDERAELVRLRREVRVKEMEIEILKRASAYLARENDDQDVHTGHVEQGVCARAPQRARGARRVIHVEAFSSINCLLAVDPEGLEPSFPDRHARHPQHPAPTLKPEEPH